MTGLRFLTNLIGFNYFRRILELVGVIEGRYDMIGSS